MSRRRKSYYLIAKNILFIFLYIYSSGILYDIISAIIHIRQIYIRILNPFNRQCRSNNGGIRIYFQNRIQPIDVVIMRMGKKYSF